MPIPAEPYDFAFDRDVAALVIIDMQRDFLEPGGFGESLGNDVSELRRCIVPTRRVLTAAREAGMVVVHTQGASPRSFRPAPRQTAARQSRACHRR